jgi:hypothetical protein
MTPTSEAGSTDMANKDRKPGIQSSGAGAIGIQILKINRLQEELATEKRILQSLIEMHDFIELEVQ